VSVNQIINWNVQSMTHFTMSMPELEAALTAAQSLSRTVYQAGGTDSREYQRAKRIAEEVQAEIAMRCSHHICAA
jgi:hypothetical protein